jgi:hypothetical protein
MALRLVPKQSDDQPQCAVVDDRVLNAFFRPDAFNIRRLAADLIVAFHQACDEPDLLVAQNLIKLLDQVVSVHGLLPEKTRRGYASDIVLANERLWHLRHPHGSA